MSLDVTIIDNFCDHCGHVESVFDVNITHNLGEMARECGLYEAMWRPYKLYPGYKEFDNYDKEYEFEESVTVIAGDIIPYLQKGIDKLELKPEVYKEFNPENGWGDYDGLLRKAKEFLEACTNYPNAKIEVSR
jgi:hypothetical protein